MWKAYRRRQAVAEMLEAFADEHLLEYTTDWWWKKQRLTGEYRGASVDLWTAVWPNDYSSVGIHFRIKLPDAIPSDLCLYHADHRGYPIRNVGDVPETDIAADTIGDDWTARTDHPDQARRLLANDALCGVIRRTRGDGHLAGLIRGRAQCGDRIGIRDEASLRIPLDALVDLHDAFAQAADKPQH